jgi:2-polyprenyl-6-methoxyphenol hydroxylase-like FAD-dependent oxidoreductase
MAQKHVVVIGAGPAGINLVLQLAELPSVKVTLLERKGESLAVHRTCHVQKPRLPAAR